MAQVRITNLCKHDFPLTVFNETGELETVIIAQRGSRLFQDSLLPPDVDTKVALKMVKKTVVG